MFEREAKEAMRILGAVFGEHIKPIEATVWADFSVTIWVYGGHLYGAVCLDLIKQKAELYGWVKRRPIDGAFMMPLGKAPFCETEIDCGRCLSLVAIFYSDKELAAYRKAMTKLDW